MEPWRRSRHGWGEVLVYGLVARYYFTRPLKPTATMSIFQAA